MKRISSLLAAALVALGTLASSGAEARGRGGAIAASAIGGLTAAALIGAASNAYASSAYGYGYPYDRYGYAYPAYGYGYDFGYASIYTPRRVIRSYGYGYTPVGFFWGGPRPYYSW